MKKLFVILLTAFLAVLLFSCDQESQIAEAFGIKVTFNANGGEGTMASQKISGKSGTLNANTFTKTGYHFSQWNTKADGTGTAYADKGNIESKSDITIYARWAANTYTVAFSSNEGTGTMNSMSLTYDEETNLTENSFTREGFIFSGWNTASDGTGTSYADKASVENLTATDGATVTLYAQWGQPTITFNANGGSGTMNNQPVTYNTATAINDNAFTAPDGKVFVGWTTNSDGTGTYYENGESVTLTANLTLYAQWGIPLTSSLTGWADNETYTLTSDVTIEDTISVGKNVKLFLPKNLTLTAKNTIDVDVSGSLTIDGKGTVTTTKTSQGSGHGMSIGTYATVTIDGGTVIATNSSQGADAISLNYSGSLIINGGALTAQSKNGTSGAGIGSDNATVIINGGSVTAQGGGQCAGISVKLEKGYITINGGTVTATGDGNGGAGIGSNSGSSVLGTVEINGGTVTATGGSGAVGIGAGNGGSSHGTLTIGTGVHVYKTDETTAYANGPQDNVTTRYQKMTVNNVN